MKLNLSLQPTVPPHIFLRCSSSVKVSCFHYTNKTIRSSEMKAVPGLPARDRVIDFGKHKGKMLGMLSSEYLRWMSKNLITGDYEKWGKLAEDVLEDEVYADRMEWELAERLLTGEGMVGSSGSGVAGELAEMSKRFGWDYNDRVGWSKVDFGLLGTSKGSRLPRVQEKPQQEEEESNFKKLSGKGGGGAGVGREKRRERAAKRREHQTAVGRNRSIEKEETNVKNNERKEEEGAAAAEEIGIGRFPGRRSLINKAMNIQSE